MLSVVIPVYNSEETISRCLKSVLEQTYKDLEIIIIDDGSTDKSFEKCRGFSDERITILKTDNGGVSRARNIGISKAKGEYITFLDSDDWIDKNAYEKMMACFDKNIDIDIVVGGFVRQIEHRVTPILEKDIECVMNTKAAIKELLSNRIFRGELCDKIYKRKLFEQVSLDEEITIAEDLLANWQIFHLARNVYYAPIWGYHYVVNKKSACHVYTRKNLSHIKSIEKIISMPDSSKYINSIVNGIYGRTLASNILKMQFIGDESIIGDIEMNQRKLRACFFRAIVAPGLSLRQRLGIVYAVLPRFICKILSVVAVRFQKNM